MLLEYQKRLISAGGSTPATPTYELISDVELVDTYDGVVLVGVSGYEEFSVEEYFSTLENCTVELEENELGMFSTGAKFVIKNNNGDVVEEYVISVTGDVNGDGNCGDPLDFGEADLVANGMADFATAAMELAGDVNGDEFVDPTDSTSLEVVASGMADIDFVGRTVVFM